MGTIARYISANSAARNRGEGAGDGEVCERASTRRDHAGARTLKRQISPTCAVTHSPTVASALLRHRDVEVYLIGGRLLRHSMVTCGGRRRGTSTGTALRRQPSGTPAEALTPEGAPGSGAPIGVSGQVTLIAVSSTTKEVWLLLSSVPVNGSVTVRPAKPASEKCGRHPRPTRRSR
jgi:hypothetical protein